MQAKKQKIKDIIHLIFRLQTQKYRINSTNLSIFFYRLFCQFKNSPYICNRKREIISLQEQKCSPKDGPFVYRLGRKIFILERGVRFPHGLQLKK